MVAKGFVFLIDTMFDGVSIIERWYFAVVLTCHLMIVDF